MKKFIYIFIAIVTITFTSCGTTANIKKSEADVAGYTLKNKKELMQQKILHMNSKTVIAVP